jgi:hypothetical protein
MPIADLHNLHAVTAIFAVPTAVEKWNTIKTSSYKSGTGIEFFPGREATTGRTPFKFKPFYKGEFK